MVIGDFKLNTLCISTSKRTPELPRFTKLVYYTGTTMLSSTRFWEIAVRWNSKATLPSYTCGTVKCEHLETEVVHIATDSEIRELLSHWDASDPLSETLDLFISEVDRLHGRTVPDEVERLRRIVGEMRQG